MLKRVIVCVLVLVTVLSPVISVQAYGDDNLSDEGQVCRDLGMLKGDTGIVDAAYLRTKPNRLQSAIMFLRLKGLEERALSYEGDRNFSDARTIVWPQGRNVLCYLKEHPELGWIGDGGNFRPFELIDAQAYYKVMLEALGYKQVIDGGGDFKWSEVLAFAAEKGLKNAAQDKVFTVNSLAAATVEALKTNTRGSGKKLIYNLVEDGHISKRRAIELKLYAEEINIGVKNVKPLSNSKIEVEFNGTVDAYTVENTDNYKLKYKETTVDIKAARIKNDTSVVLDIAAMKEDAEYVLTIDGKAHTFRAVRKDTTATKLISAACKDADLIELVFDRVLDNISAQDTNTYSIKDIGIRSATLDSTSTKVRLVTNGIQASRSYDLKISNIKNADGVVTKSITKRITGVKDTTSPKLEKMTAVNNTKLILEFSDKNGINKSSAQYRSNYSITSSDGELGIVEAKVFDRDGDGLWETVELKTEVQTANRNYTLSISGITDDSVQNNVIGNTKKSFRGKTEDKTSPTVARNPVAITNTLIEVQFSDSNALDVDSACDLSNYEISDELNLIDAKIKNPDDLYSNGGKTVLLRTSEMEKSKSYYLTVKEVKDEFGNELKPYSGSSYRKYRFSGRTEDNTPPYVVSVDSSESKTIVLGFDDRLDKASAENTQNYRIDGLDLVTKAKLSDTEKTVTLTVNALSSSSKYTVLMNNIKDLAGNAMNNVSVKVQVNDGGYSLTPAEVDYIEALNENEIWVHFDGKVRATNAKLVASGVTFKQAGSVLDEGMTIVMKASSRMQNKRYEVTSLTDVRNGSTGYYELEQNLDFYGTTTSNEPPVVSDWEQLNVKTFRVVFSEPVLRVGNTTSTEVTKGIQNPSGVRLDWDIKINPKEENSNEAYSTVDFTATGKIPDNKEFRFNFSEILQDYMGEAVRDDEDTDSNKSKYTILSSNYEDTEKPVITSVEAVTKTKVQVTFDEDILSAGTYKITYADENNKSKTVSISRTEIDSDERNKVNIITGTQLDYDTQYLLVPLTGATDLAGNRLDTRNEEHEFPGTNLMSSDYIQGIDFVDFETFEVIKSSKIYSINSVKELSSGGSPEGGNLIDGTPKKVNDSTYEVAVRRPLLNSLRYEITVDSLTYRFSGLIENSNITLNAQSRQITFYDSNTSTQEVLVERDDYTDLKVNESGGRFYIDQAERLKNGDVLYVYVKQSSNNKILYGAKITVEGLAGASSEKEITTFGFKEIEQGLYTLSKQSANEMSMTVPYGTDLTKLVAVFKSSAYSTVRVGTKVQVSGETQNDFTNPVYYTVTAEDGSTKTYAVTVKMAPTYEKKITGFVIDLEKDAEGVIDHEKRSVTVTVPYDTDVTALKPVITTSKDTWVDPGSGAVRDFTNPRTYTVTSDKDKSKQEYTVTVIKAESGEKSILGFAFKNVEDTVSIDQQDGIINVTVPYGTDVSKLIPEIKISEGAAIEPLSGKETDFSKSVSYVVKAKNGTTRTYKVVVSAVQSTYEKKITSFVIDLEKDAEGVIDHEKRTVMVTVPYGTDVTALKPIITTSKDTWVDPGSGAVRDFTNPRTYTVTSDKDKSKQEYTVTVIKAESGEKSILGFAFKSVEATVKINEQDINVTVPYGTVVSSLIPEMKVSEGATVKPSSGEETDFSKPVSYVVKAQDDTTKAYLVTVKVAESTYEKKITSFVIDLEKDAEGVIDHEKRTVMVTVPYGTDVTALKPIITTSKDTWVDPDSGASRDFTNPRTYTVTSDKDKSKQEYTVTVTKAESDEKSILSFEIKNAEAKVTIDQQDGIVNVTVPYGTNVSELIPEIKVSEGATVEPLSGEAEDFSDPVSYVVQAQNGTTGKYLVKVTVAESTYKKEITSFAIDLEKDAEGVIDQENHKISIVVPYDTDITALKPIITTSGDTWVEPGSGEARDFTNPRTYTVISEKDKSKQEYIVEVTKAANSENQITAFSFAGLNPVVLGQINDAEGKIVLIVPADMAKTNLVATFTSSPGSTVTASGVKQESGKTANDFSSSDGITYTVTAQDGSSVRQYKVVVLNSIALGFYDFGIRMPGTEKIAAGVIDQINKTITVTMPKGTDISKLTGVFMLSDNTAAYTQNEEELLLNKYTIQRSGVTVNDFSNEVKYILMKGNERMEYTVKVALPQQ